MKNVCEENQNLVSGKKFLWEVLYLQDIAPSSVNFRIILGSEFFPQNWTQQPWEQAEMIGCNFEINTQPRILNLLVY